MYEMLSVNNSCSREDILQLERISGCILPKDYIEFLLECNGGEPKVGGFYVKDGPPEYPFSSVHEFFGFHNSDNSSDIIKMLIVLPKSVPSKFIPIAVNDSDDLICLDLRNGYSVVFWSQLNFWGENIWSENDVYWLASSFDEFFRSLRPIDSIIEDFENN